MGRDGATTWLEERIRSSTGLGLRIGTIVSVLGDGSLMVDYPGNEQGPLPARTLLTVEDTNAARALVRSQVLLAHSEEEPRALIVLGVVRDGVMGGRGDSGASPRSRSVEEVVMDVERLRLEARRGIVLRCGKASIEVDPDGSIAIRGTRLLSRSSGVNKIKGATVDIN